jgi:hypothetical protein
MFGLFGADKDVNVLLLAWAEHHPYLFTLIEISKPALIAGAALTIIIKLIVVRTGFSKR